MFLTSANFNEYPYQLPNLEEEDEAADFQLFVNKVEETRLREVLGNDLYEALAEYMALNIAVWVAGVYNAGDKREHVNKVWTCDANGTATEPGVAGWTEDEVLTRWVELKNGVDYEYNDKEYHWDGLVNLLKPVVYSDRLRDLEDSAGSMGVVKATMENTTGGQAAIRICDSFNEFVRLAGDYCNQKDTLFGFLYNSGALFSDSIGDDADDVQDYLLNETEPQRDINEFDL